jgi:hypothetical protein
MKLKEECRAEEGTREKEAVGEDKKKNLRENYQQI